MKKERNFSKTFLTVTAGVAFLGAIVAACKVIFSKRGKKENKNPDAENSRNTLAILCIVLVALAALITGIVLALRYIRKVRGGYLIDLFDRDEYDVISPEEEDNFEDLIRGELRPSGDDDYAVPNLRYDVVPLDDEATEDNYN